MLKGKKIILGVTGGIAVYKAADLVSRLKKQGANVEVIMTDAAQKFVDPLTFQTMSVNPVHTGMFKEIDRFDVEHISLAQKSDLIIIAPATANTIGKIANGIADNLLTTVIMASSAKIVFAPAMNTFMYNNLIVQENIKKLKELDYRFVEPGVGLLACGDYGAGKMAEPENVVNYIVDIFTKKDLSEKKIIVTAGPTIEPIDPVRYITNHSSGKMGYNLAREASRRGADVILVSGPTNLSPPQGVKSINVKTTQDMFEAVGENFDKCDVLIKSAAPVDYRPGQSYKNKIKKDSLSDNELSIRMVKNPDIAEYYGNRKGKRIVVGFAAETNNILEYAKAKLIKKKFDFIVANDITKGGAGFNTDTNIINIIDSDDNITTYPLMSKREVANIILDEVVNILENKS